MSLHSGGWRMVKRGGTAEHAKGVPRPIVTSVMFGDASVGLFERSP
jgi:hypothetical protein